jgi:manganese/zinc/iron transport system ATP- binding protein
MSAQRSRTRNGPTRLAPDHDSCLVLRDVAVAYGRKVVLSGVSADIQRGQVVGIVGPNGSGKSTLLKAIIGLVPLVSGRIELFGQPARAVKGHIAYVPQREMVDWEFPVTVFDVVMMGRLPRIGWLRSSGRDDEAAAGRALERVGMLDYRATQIGRLSGGQQQRVFIARALAQDSDVYLLDEPMTGIDTTTQEVILEVIDELRASGRIILLATHDLASASCACDCLCCVNQRMVSYGPTEETYTPEVMAETYGGLPVIMLNRPGGVLPDPHAHDLHAHEHHPHDGHTH